jgi:hypothetical protein
MNTPTPPYPAEDVRELKRFKKLVRNVTSASDVQLPDERFLAPHREYNHYDLHYMDPVGMTVINTFHFKTLEACKEAIAHTKSFLPTSDTDELKDS